MAVAGAESDLEGARRPDGVRVGDDVALAVVDDTGAEPGAVSIWTTAGESALTTRSNCAWSVSAPEAEPAVGAAALPPPPSLQPASAAQARTETTGAQRYFDALIPDTTCSAAFVAKRGAAPAGHRRGTWAPAR
jgi:hypothetical protein